MKNYKIEIIKNIIAGIVLIVGLTGYSQESILFSFANNEITNDGVDNYFEVDVMLKTITPGSFKLGSGQLYFNYNTAAFGSNIGSTSGFEITYPNNNYIIAQTIDLFPVPFYGDFEINNNLASRVAWAFDQKYSALTFANDNVGPTLAKLIHIKIKFLDVNEDPMFEFHYGGVFEDQFVTACGSETNGGGVASPDCTGYPGIQMTNDTFNNNVVLGIEDVNKLVEFSVFPNPAKDFVNVKINKTSEYSLIDVLGKVVITGAFNQGLYKLQLKNYDSGVYFLNFTNDANTYVKRVVVE